MSASRAGAASRSSARRHASTSRNRAYKITHATTAAVGYSHSPQFIVSSSPGVRAQVARAPLYRAPWGSSRRRRLARSEPACLAGHASPAPAIPGTQPGSWGPPRLVRSRYYVIGPRSGPVGDLCEDGFAFLQHLAPDVP